MNLSARIKSWKDYKILFRILSTADTKSFDVEYFERLTSAYFCTGSSSWIDEIQNDSVRMVSTAVRTSYCNRNSVENSIKNSAVSMSLLLEIMSYQPWKHCSKDFLGDFFYPALYWPRTIFKRFGFYSNWDMPWKGGRVLIFKYYWCFKTEIYTRTPFLLSQETKEAVWFEQYTSSLPFSSLYRTTFY